MNADILVVDGHAFSWKRLCELRREQLEERAKARGIQPKLFELHDDHRPLQERFAAERYLQPSLLEAMARPISILPLVERSDPAPAGKTS